MSPDIDSYSTSPPADADSEERRESQPAVKAGQGMGRTEPQFDHRLADQVAARTETPAEAAIDAANGLRGHGGRRPVPEDFDGLLTAAGDSGDIVGSAVDDDSVFTIGEDGATKGTLQDEG